MALFEFDGKEYDQFMRYWIRSAFILWFAIVMTLGQGCATSQSANPSLINSFSSNSGASSPISGATTSGSEPAIAPVASTFNPAGYKVDSAESKALSDYLTQHKLPLVGAQVMHGPVGQRGVVLYGFVGSDFGKQDAVTKARNYLSDSSIAVNNRIKVEPELLTSNGASMGTSNSEPGAASADNDSSAQSYPGPDSYTQQQNEAQQYVQQQNTGSAISSMSPLLILGMMALSMTSGGAFAVGPGSFGSFGSFGSPGLSPFGAPPYNPYPGFSSPSYGNAPSFGSGAAPYGSASPYNPYGP